MRTRKNSSKRVIIVGAGVAGKETLRAITPRHQREFFVVGFVDDDPAKLRAVVAKGLRVLGPISALRSLVRTKRIDEVLVAIPSAEGGVIRKIINACKSAKVSFRIVPRLLEIVQGRVHVEQVRDIRPEDMIGRALHKTDQRFLGPLLKNRTLLVTGGAGSIGSELCRQIATYSPKRLIILDWWENGMFEIENELRERFPRLNIDARIANIQDHSTLQRIFHETRPEFVFHAAAYKHVPLMERHPVEALKNNILGTWNVSSAARKVGVKTFVLISTDKAVKPTNIMGATKAVAETLVHSLNGGKTKFCAVRFGNVLASHGSVVPIFLKQIRNGGPVTITHPDMVRFFMSIPEAVQLILQAGQMSRGGEIFVLDMGEPVRILDLATTLIRLSGFEPNRDIQIQYTGLRPGEKLYEETLTEQENTRATKRREIYVTEKHIDATLRIPTLLKGIDRCVRSGNPNTIRRYLKTLVPDYRPKPTNRS